jgi:hypothetical protein
MINKVIQTRDIIFNKDETFNGDLNKMKDDYLYIKLDKLTKLLIEVELSIEIFPRLNETQNENISWSTS